MKTKIGGQAVIEGVMMRGATSMALTVRDELGQMRTETTRLATKKPWYKKIPFLRGIINLVTSMIDGTKIISKSAELMVEEEIETSNESMGGVMAISTLLGVALALLYAENVILAGVCIALVGVGMGIMIPTVVGELTAIAMHGNDQGKIMGGYSMAMNLGNFVSAILVTILITSMGYTDAFITAAIVSVAIGILVQGVNLSKGKSVKS